MEWSERRDILRVAIGLSDSTAPAVWSGPLPQGMWSTSTEADQTNWTWGHYRGGRPIVKRCDRKDCTFNDDEVTFPPTTRN